MPDVCRNFATDLEKEVFNPLEKKGTIMSNYRELITEELRKQFEKYPLYSQDGKGKDAICVALFRIVTHDIRWYIMEGQQEGNDFTLFGIVVGLYETEYGYNSATEMANVTSMGCKIEADKDFKPCRLADIKDEELQRFLSSLYD